MIWTTHNSMPDLKENKLFWFTWYKFQYTQRHPMVLEVMTGIILGGLTEWASTILLTLCVLIFMPWHTCVCLAHPSFCTFWYLSYTLTKFIKRGRKGKRKKLLENNSDALTFWTVVVRSKQSWIILFFVTEKSVIPVNGALESNKNSL